MAILYPKTAVKVERNGAKIALAQLLSLISSKMNAAGFISKRGYRGSLRKYWTSPSSLSRLDRFSADLFVSPCFIGRPLIEFESELENNVTRFN